MSARSLTRPESTLWCFLILFPAMIHPSLMNNGPKACASSSKGGLSLGKILWRSKHFPFVILISRHWRKPCRRQCSLPNFPGLDSGSASIIPPKFYISVGGSDMRLPVASLFLVTSITLLAAIAPAQTKHRKVSRSAPDKPPGTTVKICQGLPIPPGYIVTGYMTTSACPHGARSEEHTSELQSRLHLVCRLLLEKKKKTHQRLVH